MVTLGVLSALLIVGVLDDTMYPTLLGICGGGDANDMLRLAVEGNNLAAVRRAIARGAEPNAPDCWGVSPLSRAATAGDAAICNELLEHGADANGGAEYRPPLICAALHGHERILDLLLRHGADINATTPNGSTALNIAASLGQQAFARALIAAGADVNAADVHGWTPLMGAAAKDDCPELVQALLAAGARPDAQNDDGDTALGVAARDGSHAAVLLLIRHRVSPPRRYLLGVAPPAPSPRPPHC